MSAFVVSRSHIDALVYTILNGPADREGGPVTGFSDGAKYQYTEDLKLHSVRDEDASAVGQMLWDENRKSVAYRYGYMPLFPQYEYLEPKRKPTAVETLKLIACYDYQTCEHPGWKGSQAWWLMKNLRNDLIDDLPGYSEAPWNWYDSERG
jgi:hypothetical protein